MKDSNKNELKSSLVDLSDKKKYSMPILHKYGAVKNLTAGGSGNAQESSSGQRPRP